MEASQTAKAVCYIICILEDTYIVSLQFYSDPELIRVEVGILEDFFKCLLIL